MDARNTDRYCQSCGARLASDNRQPLCAPCQKKAPEAARRPPHVPPEFWEVDLIRDALATWHVGRVVQAYRHHPFHGRALSQEMVARWLGITQTQLSRVESGPPVKDLGRLVHWARIFGIPSHLLWFKLPDEGHDTRSRSRGSFEAVVLPTSLSMPRPPGPQVGFLPSPYGLSDASSDAAAMQGFRAADLQVGGGHLYATVLHYLQTEIAPRLFGVVNGADSQAVFTAAAGLTEMAGWMAHDAGRDIVAERHFHRALDLVKIGGDRQLGAHILGSMSHLAHHLDKPNDAIALARSGQEILRTGSRNPGLESRLLAMEARGFAAHRESAKAARLLVLAEKALAGDYSERPSQWVSHFDEGSLAGEAVRCMRQLGQYNEAERQAQRVIALRPGGRRRSRAFGQLGLVTALIAQGKPDEACGVALEVLQGTQSLSSFLVIRQLRDLHELLQPYRSSGVVADFLECLTGGLRERLRLYRWLDADGDGGPTGRGEDTGEF